MENTIERQDYTRGGLVTGPGTKTSDSIPALIPQGAFVLNAFAVELFPKQFLKALNTPSEKPLECFLSAGEFVVRPEIVAAIGKEYFTELNSLGHEAMQGTLTEERESLAFFGLMRLVDAINGDNEFESVFSELTEESIDHADESVGKAEQTVAE